MSALSPFPITTYTCLFFNSTNILIPISMYPHTQQFFCSLPRIPCRKYSFGLMNYYIKTASIVVNWTHSGNNWQSFANHINMAHLQLFLILNVVYPLKIHVSSVYYDIMAIFTQIVATFLITFLIKHKIKIV